MSIGLTSSILNTKVYVGNESRIQSNRIQDPASMMCPMWSGQDLAGRPVCSDSFYTKRAGCNSALDRIKVENDQRPKYANHVTISAAGIAGADAGYGSNVTKKRSHVTAHENYMGPAMMGGAGVIGEPDYGMNITREESGSADLQRMMRSRTNGRFGLVSTESILPSRGSHLDASAANAYQSADSDALEAQKRRVAQNLNVGYQSQVRYDRMGASNLNPNTHVLYNPNSNFTARGQANYVKLSQMP